LSVTLREEHKPRVFENRMMRKIVGPKRDGVTGYLRILHDEELHDFTAHQNIMFFSVAPYPLVGQGLLFVKASRSYSDAPHSVGSLWTCDQPVAEAST
jgi:hypothetical protein